MAKKGAIEKSDDQLAGVARALRVLEQLADEPAGLSFNDVLRLLGVNRSIVFKILGTLVANRYVFKDDRTGNYCLTFKVSNLAMRKLNRARLLDQSMVILRDLADSTGEFVRLAIVEQEDVTWVLSALGRKRVLQVDPNYSSEIGLNTHAAGKAWLATLRPEDAQRLIRKHGLIKMTNYSLVTMKAITADLARTALNGYSLSFEEHALGVGAIGAPVMVRRLNDTVLCQAVITLAAPTAHMDKAALLACAPQVIAAANRLAEVWPEVGG